MSLPSLSTFVRGLPITQGSKKQVEIKSGPRAGEKLMIEDRANELKKWRDAVALALLVARRKVPGGWLDAKDKRNGRVPYKLTVVFIIPRPPSDLTASAPIPELDFFVPKPSAPKTATRKPDLDKLVRAVADATKEIIWKDDCQMVRLEAYKVHGQSVVGAWIRIEQVDPMSFPPHLMGELQREGLAIVGVDVVGRSK